MQFAAIQYERQRNVFCNGASLASSRSVTHTGGGLATNLTANDHTATVTITSGGSSYVLGRNVFDPGGRAVMSLADNSAAINVIYDGANREIVVADALGNSIANTFDPNGNLTGTARTELCTISGVDTQEVFASAAYFDCLNQVVLQAAQGADGNLSPSVVPPAGSVSFWDMAPWNVTSSTLISCTACDSRGNAVLAIDPKGNSAVTVFDGASRAVQFQQHLRQLGQGQNPPAPGQTLLPGSAGTIVTTPILDGNGRRTQLVDDRGNVTRWEFDTLDRETKMIFQDGSMRISQYDEASDVIQYTDEIGNVFANVFDALGRKVSTDITIATGPDLNVSTNTQSQSFQYDGLSRTTFARNSDQPLADQDAPGAMNADVKLFYDSINRILEDSQTFDGNTRNVTNTAFASYPVAQFQFPDSPSGPGRLIDNAYDALYRRNAVNEDSTGAPIASWDFFGPARVAQVVLGNGLACTWMNDALGNSAVQGGTAPVPNPPWGGASDDRLGYDGAGRMIAKRYLPVSSPQYVLAPGTTSWTPPQSGVYQVECYGSGGYGDSASGMSGGGGGGGGGYSSAFAVLSSESTYGCDVDGAGDVGLTSFSVTGAYSILANSGENASGSSGGSGGTAGENGAAGANGGATDGGAGGNAGGPAGGAGGSGAVNGDGGPAGSGSPYGGGGGGDDYDGDGAGSGADGAIVLTAQNASSSTTPVVGFTTAFDRSSNKLYERALHAADRSSLYEPYDSNQIPMGGYDSLDRLLQYRRGVLSATGGDGGNGGGSIAAPIGLSNTDQQRSYLLDSVGNWRNTQFTPAGSTQQTEIRQHNGLNQITRIQNVVTGMIPPFYDSNGNLTSYGVLSYQWDALNRLAVAGGVLPSGEYYYDALNRRIRKIAGDTTTDFIYMGWRCLEDRNPSGGEDESTDTPIIQYIWGIYLDELLQITTLVEITTGAGDIEQVYPAGAYYPLQDLLYRTTATTDDSGNIVEAYDFDAYGNTLIFNAPDGDGNWWGDLAVQVGTSLCQFLFTGQRFDAETGFYYYKWRYYWPMLGRFLSRDPVLYNAGDQNLYRYCADNPLYGTDPTGLRGPRHHWFMRLGESKRGQDLVNKICHETTHINIDMFTTEFTQEEHDFIHQWVWGEVSFKLYDHIYLELLGASTDCCDFLIGVKALMVAFRGAILAAQHERSLPGSVAPLDLINYYTKSEKPISRLPEFNQRIKDACGCGDVPEKQTEKRFFDRFNEFKHELQDILPQASKFVPIGPPKGSLVPEGTPTPVIPRGIPVEVG